MGETMDNLKGIMYGTLKWAASLAAFRYLPKFREGIYSIFDNLAKGTIEDLLSGWERHSESIGLLLEWYEPRLAMQSLEYGALFSLTRALLKGQYSPKKYSRSVLFFAALHYGYAGPLGDLILNASNKSANDFEQFLLAAVVTIGCAVCVYGALRLRSESKKDLGLYIS